MRAPDFLSLHGLWAWALCLAGLSWGAQAATVTLQDAVAQVQVGTVMTRQAVQLPYHWDQQHSGEQGFATLDIAFDLPDAPVVPFALYVPRLGNAYEIWLNGVLQQRNGDMRNFNGSNYAKVPRYISIAPGALQAHNLLQVRIRADRGRKGGLAPLVLGPDDEVYPLYYRDYRMRGTGSLIVLIVSVLMGCAALALWATQVEVRADGRLRRDPLYLIAGLAELFWAIRVGDAIVENPPLPWAWWGTLAVGASALWALGMALLCVLVAGWDYARWTRYARIPLVAMVVGSVVCSAAALGWGQSWALSGWYALEFVVFVPFVAVFLWSAVRRGSSAHRAMAAVMLLNVGVGVRDLYMLRFSAAYGQNSLQRYSGLLFALVLAYIVIQRFRTASAHARDLTANLASRVAQKEQELVQTYQHLEQLARQQERTAERSRILRDMHDGVGSHISTAMRQLQSGKASAEEVLRTLRDSLDQLKLSIDALNLPPGDVTALLANLRYRLEPRFKASDIALVWKVDLIAPLARLDDKAMRQLQFMVYEAVSNVLQHAQAKTLQIEAAAVAQGIRVRVVDDGRGFDVGQPLRKGLLSLRERGLSLGATVRFESQPGATVVEILIPLLV